MIEAGRKPESDLIDDETNVARQEISLETAQNTLDNDRLDLLQFLNLPADFFFKPAEENIIKIMPPGLIEALDIALKNRTDYQQQLRDMESAKIDYTVAGNSRLWDLSIGGSTGRSVPGNTYSDVIDRMGSAGKNDWGTQLMLTIPFRNLDIERQYLGAKVALEKAKISMKKTEINAETDVRNKLRNVKTQYKQYELAIKSRSASQKSFDAEQEKYLVGRTSNYNLVQKQNDLISTQYQELQSRVDYLNALTSLDYALGTTLKTWGIEIDKNSSSKTKPVIVRTNK